jgi:hypothetical protein
MSEGCFDDFPCDDVLITGIIRSKICSILRSSLVESS